MNQKKQKPDYRRIGAAALAAVLEGALVISLLASAFLSL